MAPRPDLEPNTPHNLQLLKEESFAHGSSHSMREPAYDRRQPPRFNRFLHSFRRDPNLARPHESLLPPYEQDNGRSRNGSHRYDLRMATLGTAGNTGLSRKLKGRHLQMIAIGGSIGTGLFVVSGKALAVGGPASLLIAFSVVGAMLYCTCQALGELAVIFPIAGSFSSWATRFLDPSWGFAMGWK